MPAQVVMIPVQHPRLIQFSAARNPVVWVVNLLANLYPLAAHGSALVGKHWIRDCVSYTYMEYL